MYRATGTLSSKNGLFTRILYTEKKTKTHVTETIERKLRILSSARLYAGRYSFKDLIDKSADLLALTKKTEMKNVESITQAETGSLIINVPDNARMTKLMDIRIISRKIKFLK